MSGPNDTDDPRAPDETAAATDDDGWGEAAESVTPPRRAEPSRVLEEDRSAAPTEPEEPEPSRIQDRGAAPTESTDLDDMWGMAPPPPVGQEPPRILSEARREAATESKGPSPSPSPKPSPTKGPAGSGSASAGAGSSEGDDLEPMPDYSAEAERWREELHSAVAATDAKPSRKRGSATSTAHRAPPAPRRRLSARSTRIAIGAGIGVVLIGVVVALGWFNSRHYHLVCTTHEIRAERGRGFPPWGTRGMTGAEWRAIKIPRNTECTAHRASTLVELEGIFLDALLGQANARLASAEPENIDVAQAQLEQAFLLTRTPERRDKRKEVERLVGDVEYWRAAAQVRAAVAELGKAGDQFEGAAKRLPRHQTDSAAWAEYTRHMSDELLRGPPALRPTDPSADRPGDTPPFKGTGPDSPVRMPDAGVPAAEPPVDAQPGIMLPPPTDAAPPPPDAGLPKGGVLL